jgi:hypothetical protein
MNRRECEPIRQFEFRRDAHGSVFPLAVGRILTEGVGMGYSDGQAIQRTHEAQFGLLLQSAFH